ncbi:hypothetical protein [Paenibacillus tarimensis]|uniref:hypothetical protein n=1 Tax=Paenibacillus tarimensis TaxID=416012 RepID=UPI001F44D71F|nr:hypothetical protein [Paenibacillus tarimensis]MCF2943353.1 hypothetical protein [Paenibacillus tarimensis]
MQVSFYEDVYGQAFMKQLREQYAPLPDEEKERLIRKWYNETQGLLTPEQVLEDLKHAGS